MPTMTHTALSDCSYPESTAYNIRDEINVTITRLKVVIDEEASLRKALRALLVKRREEAIEKVRMANFYLDLVNEEEAAFCDGLMKAAASANEGLQGSGSGDSRKQDETALPTPPGDHSFSKRLTEKGRDDSAPPMSATDSMRGLCNDPLRSPIKSMHQFDSPSPLRSARGLADEPNGSPDRATHDDIYSIPSITSSTLAHYAKSPAHSTYALEPPPKTPAYSTYKLEDEPNPLSPTHSNHGLPSDTPPRSPARSAQALGHEYLSPEAAPSQVPPGKTYSSLPAFTLGDNCISGIEDPKKSATRHDTALPQTVSFGGGGFGTSPTANISFGGGGFGTSPTPDTGFGFGASPSANTTFGFGGHPTNTGFAFCVGSQPPSAIIGFGAVSSGNTEFGFGGTSQASPSINFGVRSHHPTFDSDISPFDATVHQMQTEAAVGEMQASMDAGLEMVAGEDHIQAPPAREPSPIPEPPAPKKKKKGKKNKEIRLSEEEKLEAELKQLEAARLLAELAENERIECERSDEEERLRVIAEEENEHHHYLSLKEASVMAEERLCMVQAELDALEAQKVAILQQAQSAREQEENCRYHEILRNKRIGLN